MMSEKDAHPKQALPDIFNWGMDDGEYVVDGIKRTKRAAQKAKLGKRVLDALIAPAEGVFWTNDTVTPHLAVGVWPSGGKVFYWIGRGPDSRFLRFKLAKFPEVSVENARKLAAKVSLQVANGEDPRREKQKRQSEPT